DELGPPPRRSLATTAHSVPPDRRDVPDSTVTAPVARPQTYLELIFTVPAERAQFAADLLREAAGVGVWLEHPFTQPDSESEPRLDEQHPVTVRLCLSHTSPNSSLRPDLEGLLADAGIAARVCERVIHEEDW